jgi:hypothetical protein
MLVQNPLSDADSDALLRILSLVEGGVRAAPDVILARHLRDGLAACGLLAGDAPLDAVGGALAQLQARYRYSLGEYTERVTDGMDQLDNR